VPGEKRGILHPLRRHGGESPGAAQQAAHPRPDHPCARIPPPSRPPARKILPLLLPRPGHFIPAPARGTGPRIFRRRPDLARAGPDHRRAAPCRGRGSPPPGEASPVAGGFSHRLAFLPRARRMGRTLPSRAGKPRRLRFLHRGALLRRTRPPGLFPGKLPRDIRVPAAHPWRYPLLRVPLRPAGPSPRPTCGGSSSPSWTRPAA